jgi:hypothetical protein
MNEFGSVVTAVEAPAGRVRRRVGFIVAGMTAALAVTAIAAPAASAMPRKSACSGVLLDMVNQNMQAMSRAYYAGESIGWYLSQLDDLADVGMSNGCQWASKIPGTDTGFHPNQ